jgi:chromosomal replication initiation ATPase DnaA
VRRTVGEAVVWSEILRVVSEIWDQPWEELLKARGSGGREAALLLGRTRGRLSLKKLGQLLGGVHHNAVSIAIRRFNQRLDNDQSLRRKFSLVQKALDHH